MPEVNEINAGYVKLYRKLLDNPIMKKPELLQLFIYCLLKANHEPKRIVFNGVEMVVGTGQFITGRNSLAEELGQNPRTMYDYLNMLKKLKIINIKTNNKFSLITVENYELYQAAEIKPNSKTNNQPTTSQQQANTNNNNNNIYSSCSSNSALSGDVYQFYQQNIGLLSPHQSEVLGSYLDDGIEPETIIEAIKDSLGSDNKWKYLTSILNRCIEQRIFTLEQYNAAKVEHSNKKSRDKPTSKSQAPPGANFRQRKYDKDFLNNLYENM